MIASVRANPSHWMLVISSRISGWRVTDSITLPKMNPTPMPGPTVPRPAPMPRAIALSPSSVTWAIGSRMSTIVCAPPLSVTPGACLAEVDGCERGEDEGLQRGYQPDLEDEEGEGQDQRNREVRGSRVKREGWELDAGDVDRLVVVHRQRDVPDHVREPDEEEERGHEGEPPGRRRLVHVPLRDVRVGEVVGALHD